MFSVRRSLSLLVAVGFVLTGAGPNQAEPGPSPTEEKSPLVEFKPVRVLKLDERPYGFDFSRDGGVLAVTFLSRVRIWNTKNWKEIDTAAINNKPAGGALLSPDGRILACDRPGNDDLCLFEVATGKQLWTLGYDGRRHLWGHTFSPDGKLLATATLKDGVNDIKLWDVQTGKQISCMTGLLPAWRTKCLAFSPDGKVLAVASKKSIVHLLDVKTGKELRRFVVDGFWEENVAGMAFTPDGRFLAAGRGNGPPLMVWDARDGKPVWELRWPLRPGIRSKVEEINMGPEQASRPFGTEDIAFSADGRVLVASGADRWIRVWEMATGSARYRFQPFGAKHTPRAFAVAGRFLAAIENEEKARAVHIWDLSAGPPVARPALPLDPDKTWADLRDPDAARAYECISGMAAAPKEAVALLGKRLTAVAPVKATVVDGLVRDLDSDDFKAREVAGKRLSELAEIAEPALKRALNAHASPQAAKHIKELLGALAMPPVGDRLAFVRAVEVLEKVGLPEARRVLKRLASGEPSALLTREAKAALGRIESSSEGVSTR